MLYIHPLVMTGTILFLFHVFRLGLQRTRSRRLGHKVVFQWKSHVRLGRYVMLLLFLGCIGGLAVAYIRFGEIGSSEDHFLPGVLMLPLIVAGYLTGHSMDADRRARKIVPLVHLANNALLCTLGIMQLVSGIEMLQELML